MTQQNNPFTLEQTVQKVKELNKEVKECREDITGCIEMINSLLIHVDKTYGYIKVIGETLGTAKIDVIPEEKHEELNKLLDL